MFSYLNDYYIKYANLATTNQRTFDTLKTMGIEKIYPKLLSSLLEHVWKYREGQDVNWDPLRFVVDAFITIGLKGTIMVKVRGNGILYWHGTVDYDAYDDLFENKFIEDAQNYYN